MRYRQQDGFSRVGDVGVAGHAVLGDDDRAVTGARVIDEEPAVGCVLRVEGQAEQSTFAAGENLGANVEKVVGVTNQAAARG